jgi:hypothetical protein
MIVFKIEVGSEPVMNSRYLEEETRLAFKVL